MYRLKNKMSPGKPDSSYCNAFALELVECLDQLGNLVLAEALQPAVFSDADFSHELLGLRLAPTRERLDELRDLDLADNGVIALGKSLLGRDLSSLDLRAELAALLPRLSRLLQCFSALLVSHLR